MLRCVSTDRKIDGFSGCQVEDQNEMWSGETQEIDGRNKRSLEELGITGQDNV